MIDIEWHRPGRVILSVKIKRAAWNVVYVLLFLRHKYLNSSNLTLFTSLGTTIIGVFTIVLIFILLILLNFDMPVLYDYIRF